MKSLPLTCIKRRKPSRYLDRNLDKMLIYNCCGPFFGPLFSCLRGALPAAGAPAAIAATSEDAKAFGKALIFVALGESIALYGVVISILILNKI